MARWRWSIALVVAAACGDALGPTSDFLTARARWERRGPASYAYTFQRLCFCVPEATQAVRIAVSNGAVTGVTREADGSVVPPDQVNLFFRVTLDSLFAIVAHALDAADAVTAAYDPFWGYPTAVTIDYIRNAADDEMAYSAELAAPAP